MSNKQGHFLSFKNGIPHRSVLIRAQGIAASHPEPHYVQVGVSWL